MSDFLTLDLDDIKTRVREEEEDFASATEWLKVKLKVKAFSKETLYFLRQLSGYINLDGRDGTQAGIDQEVIISLVREQIAEEKTAEAEGQYDRSGMVLEAEEEKEDLPGGEPRQAEAVPVELELFSSQEREGIKAICAYQSVLYGALPAISAFRELYLPADLLSATEADTFLRSAAVRFLSASDFERLGVSVLDHHAEIISLTTAKLTTEQKEELTGDIIVHPPTERPLTFEEGAGRWYKYTTAIALTSQDATASKSSKRIIEKILVVRESKPFSMFRDPFFRHDHSAVIQDHNSPIISQLLSQTVWAGLLLLGMRQA